jgi:hypothetical protein
MDDKTKDFHPLLDRRSGNIHEHVYTSPDTFQAVMLWDAMWRIVKQCLHYADIGRGEFREIIQYGNHAALLAEMQGAVRRLTEDYDWIFGPPLSVWGPPNLSPNEPHIIEFPSLTSDRVDLGQGFRLDGDWYRIGMRARDIYLDACKGEPDVDKATGTWLCYCIFANTTKYKDEWRYSGNLAGFAVINDDSIDHLWVAAAARRKGIASALIAYTRKEYPRATLLEPQWPEALEKMREREEIEL